MEAMWSDENVARVMKQIWLAAMEDLKRAGFDRADIVEKVKVPVANSGHEVVDALRDYVRETGFVNAHAGLTSSDVIDNARLLLIREANKEVEIVLLELVNTIRELEERFGKSECVGYTHWQYASATTWGHRFAYWREPLWKMNTAPHICLKHIGGATGDGRALAILTDGRAFRQSGLLTCTCSTGMQSSYLVDELRSAQWLEQIMGWTHKVMQDIRFLCHTGELSILKESKYRGSSAMPGKVNPIEAEQLCGLCRLQPNFSRALWDAMATNGMERTLDNSSMVRVTLPAMYKNAHYIIQKADEIMKNLYVNIPACETILQQNQKAAEAEFEMAKRIRRGESRAEVYESNYKPKE